MEYSKIQLRKRGEEPNVYYDVAVYYCNYSAPDKEKKELPIPTKVKVPEKYITTKGRAISEKLPNYSEEMERINEVKERVESAIIKFVKQFRQKPTCNQLLQELDKPVVTEIVKLEYIKDLYDEFLKKKEEDFTNPITKEVKKSINVYKNCVSDIEQFENKKKKKFIINDLEDKNFWVEFIPYLLYYKPDLTRVKKLRKGMNDNTLLKRIKTYSEFFRWLLLKEIKINYFLIVQHIKEVKKQNEVVGFEPEKFSLTIDELQFLINFTPTRFEKEKDMAVFMSLQGVRISDLITLKDEDVVKVKRTWMIQKNSIKTGAEFIVEMHPISLNIWLKYEKNFDMWENIFNENIKVVMKEFYLKYKEHYESINDDEYDLTTIKKEKNGVNSSKTRVFKYDIYSSHYNRVNFCSILGANKELSLKELMLKTAHNDSRIALKYQKKTRDISATELFPLTSN